MPGAFCVLLAAARERENMKSSSSITFYAFFPLALANSSQKDSPTYVVVLTSSQYLEQNRTIPRNTCCKFFKPRFIFATNIFLIIFSLDKDTAPLFHFSLVKNICLAFITPLSAFMSHYEWLLKIDWKTWCRVASSTTFALHITCNEWVTSTFWHHIFCHCRNLFEALLLLSILRNKRTKHRFFKILICYIFCA